MLRQALIALALAFTATTLFGCGAIENAAKAGIFLHDHCKEKLGTDIDAMTVETPAECPHEDKVKSGVLTLLKHEYTGKCVSYIGKLEGHAMLDDFNETTTDFPEKIALYAKNNTDAIQKSYQDYLNDACAKSSHGSSALANASAHASSEADKLKAAASEKADEAAAAASTKADEVKQHAQSAADAAKAKMKGDDDSDSDDSSSSDTRLFEVVRDSDSRESKPASTSLVVVAEAGMGLAVLGVVVSVRLAARQRNGASEEGIQLVDSETEI